MHHGNRRSNRCCRHRPACDSNHLAVLAAGFRSRGHGDVADHIRTVPSRHITPAARPPLGGRAVSVSTRVRVGQGPCGGPVSASTAHPSTVGSHDRALRLLYFPTPTPVSGFGTREPLGSRVQVLPDATHQPWPATPALMSLEATGRLHNPQAALAATATSSARTSAVTPSQKSTAARSYSTPIRSVWPRQCSSVRCPEFVPSEPRSTRSSFS
jgi:hypothetical protein